MSVEIVPPPSGGRIFRGERRVRLGDVAPSGRLRLDALVRYLQDVSNDDTRDAGLSDQWGWLVRRTTVQVHGFPRLGEMLTLDTFCSGIGRSWAERRVQVISDHGGLVEASTVWVHVDPASGRPTPLPEEFHEIYTPTAGGRKISARIDHPSAPESAPEPGATVRIRPWHQRIVDLDVLGHVNNAVAWACVEEVLATQLDEHGDDHDGIPVVPFTAEVGFHLPIERDESITLIDRPTDSGGGDSGGAGFDLWLVGAHGTAVSAVVRAE